MSGQQIYIRLKDESVNDDYSIADYINSMKSYAAGHIDTTNGRCLYVCPAGRRPRISVKGIKYLIRKWIKKYPKQITVTHK